MKYDRKIFDFIARLNNLRDELELIREFSKTYKKYFSIDHVTFLKVEIKRNKDRSVKESLISMRDALEPNSPAIFASSTREIHACFVRQKPVKKISPDKTTVYMFPLVDHDEIFYIVVLKFEQRDVRDYSLFRKAMKIFLNHFVVVRAQDRDFLTGLYNRRAFDRMMGTFRLENRRVDWSDRGDYLSLIDLDHFKRVNDTYGHMIGDEVLLLFTRLLRASTRSDDYIFRLGGEEFLIYTRDLSSSEANMLFNRIREKIEKEKFPRNMKITASIGYTKISYDRDSNTMVDLADKAMYAAKTAGRNRVFSYESLIEGDKIPPVGHDSDASISIWE
ncbi:MAG: GGDEF domain-containing protein [Leptospirales bacterium]